MKYKFLQLSDIHLSSHRDLLLPMIDSINKEYADFIVLTGDIIDNNKDRKSYEKVKSAIEKIKSPVHILPGEYDAGTLWNEYFSFPKSFKISDYKIDFLDTTFMGYRHSVGWGDVLEQGSPEQHNNLMSSLEEHQGYHLIFSHHPFWTAKREKSIYLQDNVRGMYAGHYRQTVTHFWQYAHPRGAFAVGFATVPLQFHGKAIYMKTYITNEDEVRSTPMLVYSSKIF